MKQILKINDDEKLRILEMHKSSTKRHYLNENTSSVPSPPSGLISDVQSELDKIINPIKDSIPDTVRALFGLNRVFRDISNYVISTIPEVYKGMSEFKSGEEYSERMYKKIMEIFEKKVNSFGFVTVAAAKKMMPDNWKTHFSRDKTKDTILGIVKFLNFLVYDTAYKKGHLPDSFKSRPTREEIMNRKKSGEKAYMATPNRKWRGGLHKWYRDNQNSIVPNVLDKIDKKINS